jgi:hypothetical protein
MTPEQRKAVTDRAVAQLQRELHANAEAIGQVMDDFDVEDVVRVAAEHSLNSFELAEAAAGCTSEDPEHPGLSCNLVAGHGPDHYALGYRWSDLTPAQQVIVAARSNPQGECTCYFEPSADGQTVTRGEDAHCPIAEHHQVPAELNAFINAIIDYVAAYDDCESDRPRLLAESRELLTRMGAQA